LLDKRSKVSARNFAGYQPQEIGHSAIHPERLADWQSTSHILSCLFFTALSAPADGMLFHPAGSRLQALRNFFGMVRAQSQSAISTA